MSYVPIRKNLGNKRWFEELEKSYNNFLFDNDAWKYNFENENKQPKGQDIEARYLSQYFFSRLIKLVDNSISVKITDKRYMVLFVDGNEYEYHFDVMNNPKAKHIFSKSIKESCLSEWEKWSGKRYHTIGNFTPIPWPALEYGSINMQNIHSAFDERWDLFLKYCQRDWNKIYNYSEIDFTHYMKITCQEMYYVEVFQSFKDTYPNKDIEGLSDNEILLWYDSIKNIDLKNKELISFAKDLQNDVRIINELIALRGRLMIAILKRKKYSNIGDK